MVFSRTGSNDMGALLAYVVTLNDYNVVGVNVSCFLMIFNKHINSIKVEKKFLY